MKEVTKEEFLEWKKSYPNHLEYTVSGISDPPTGMYHDFSTGEGWYSVVASVTLYESFPKDGTPPYIWKPNVYRIKE
jgi:hypothetical protein